MAVVFFHNLSFFLHIFRERNQAQMFKASLWNLGWCITVKFSTEALCLENLFVCEHVEECRLLTIFLAPSSSEHLP
jgi:hypothetical protein